MDDHASPPLYKQSSALMMREIMAGRLLDGEKLPPERDMADQFGTSVGTLRKALADLDGQGMLDRVQGSGNYVKANADLSGIYSFFRLELPAGGGFPTATVLSVTTGRPPQQFELGPTGHCIRRRRHLDGRPVAVEEIWLAGDRATTVTLPELSDSLYQYYKTRLGLWIARVEDRVGIAAMPDWADGQLGQMPHAMMGHVTRIGWAQDGRRAEGSFTWFDPNLCQYTNRMT